MAAPHLHGCLSFWLAVGSISRCADLNSDVETKKFAAATGLRLAEKVGAREQPPASGLFSISIDRSISTDLPPFFSRPSGGSVCLHVFSFYFCLSQFEIVEFENLIECCRRCKDVKKFIH